MNEKVREHLAALNTAWQRYARAEEEPVDPITLDALNRDYLTAWEGLDACGIAEWMLVYDPETLTFSLPSPSSPLPSLIAHCSLGAIGGRRWWLRCNRRSGQPG